MGKGKSIMKENILFYSKISYYISSGSVINSCIKINSTLSHIYVFANYVKFAMLSIKMLHLLRTKS